MQELEDTAGLPSGTSQLTQPLLQRQVRACSLCACSTSHKHEH